jgi:Tol biopolymer transport system component/DNA-binding winged helix-turn-helix (wHTH) protein
MPESHSATRIRFGEFTADLSSQELFRAGAPVRLPNQSFVVLATLLERPGQLVTREELRARVWPDNRVVEFEQGLNAVINRLREALGDDADNPAYVETLPRRGYRFIGRVETGAPETPGTELPKAERAFPWTIAAAFLVIAGSLALWRLRGESEPRLAMVTPLTSLVGEERMPALSPDGRKVVFAWNGESSEIRGFDLYLKPVDSELRVRLTRSPANAISAAWSPDGTRLAFARSSERDGGIFLIPATGGAERKLASASFAQESLMQPAWSPDGKTLAYAAIDDSGSQTIRLLSLGEPGSGPLTHAPPCWHAGAPAWSHDGTTLAFVCMTSIAVYEIHLAEPRSGDEPRRIAKLQGFPQGLAWPADRERLLVANDSGDGGGVWQLELDGTLLRPEIMEETMGSGLSATRGRIAYSRARQIIEIWHMEIVPRGSRSKKWIVSTREQLTPQYSPDASRIAFQSNRSGSPEIWIADADGGNAVRLTSFNGPLTGAPSWCSDGRRLAFDSRESGTSAIYIVDTLERVPRRVETSQSNLALPVWSADCQWLLASDGRAALYRVPAQGGEAQRFTSQRSYQAAVVGDRVIFNVAEPSGVTLWMKPLAGGEETPLPGLPRLSYADAWTANDFAIYYTDTSRTPVVLHRYAFAGATPEIIAGLPNSPTPLGGLGLAASRDGKSLLYTHTADAQSDLVLATPSGSR